MSDFILHMEQEREETPVSNIFIDEYMPAANGAYVKIYLYLLRCMNSGAQSLSVPAIADRFDHTENDVHRALAYWEKMKLLRLEYNSGRALTGICLLEPQSQEALRQDLQPSAASYDDPSSCTPASCDVAGRYTSSSQDAGNRCAAVSPAIPPESAQPSAPPKSDYSPDQLLKFQQEDEIRQLLFISEQYLGKTLSPTEISTILYFYDSLHFSADLIEYLIEYCVTKGHKSMRYIESVALAWHKEGYQSVAEVKKACANYNKNYFAVLKTFGIKGRNPVEPEIRFIDRWTRELGFSMELVLEACSRTMAAIHQPSFEYADSILKNWHTRQVKSLADVKALDTQRTAKSARSTADANAAAGLGTAAGPGASTGAGAAAVKKASASNRFHNFKQREYDFDALEKQLINH